MYSGAPFSLLVEHQLAPNFFLPVDFWVLSRAMQRLWRGKNGGFATKGS
jgi:hypothetical protein